MNWHYQIGMDLKHEAKKCEICFIKHRELFGLEKAQTSPGKNTVARYETVFATFCSLVLVAVCCFCELFSILTATECELYLCIFYFSSRDVAFDLGLA